MRTSTGMLYKGFRLFKKNTKWYVIFEYGQQPIGFPTQNIAKDAINDYIVKLAL